LGRSSPTEDVDGEVTLLDGVPQPTREQLEAAAARLVGPIQQRPPAFSALKVAGRRAYDLARRGSAVELAPREVLVYRLEVARYEYPELVLDVECGSGTYVRSLGRDLAESLSTGAVMSALTRTVIGPFTVAESVSPDSLSEASILEHLLPPLMAVAHLPRVTVWGDEIARLARGLTIAKAFPAGAERVAAVDESGELAAVLVPRGNDWLGPAVNLRS
jgi:tRNA pseudouridine55 synthase